MVAEETNAEEKSSESKAMPLNLQTENKILSRKEKRKQLKKLKRKALRKEAANKEKALEEALLNDPEEQRRLQIEEQAETEASEKARQEFEERERIWLENYQRALEEEASRRKQEEEEKLSRCQEESLANTEADWECTEEQPAEVIWQGNEIIVKKKRVKVPKQKVDESNSEEREQPISNPLPPQPAFSDGYKCLQVTSGCNVFDDIEKQMPNFGTEQDAAHCPFYIKTGACRFGSHCSRAHFYPDKSCTLLMRNMYNGPGLSWEQDEGLEYTDEEVAMHYLEFYEDVHTEFLKFGELVNFKVCRNASSHLRGNVYVHYQSLDSALAARRALNGRFYAGKQITCEFVGVTKWRLAICGEYLRSYYKTCSRGNVCNFLHCFPNPGGEYGWADRDKPPPRSWLEKMDVLFGCSRASHHDDLTPRENVWSHRTRYKVSSRKEKAYGKYSRSNDRNNHQQNSASSSSKSYSEDEKEQELDTNKSIVCSSGTKGREHNVHDKDKIKNDNEVIPRNDKKGDQRKRHRSSKTSDRSSHGSKRRHHQEHTLADQDLEFGSINTSDTDDEPIQDKVKKNDRHESSLQSSHSKKEEKRPARRRSPEFDNIDDHDKTRSSLRRDQQYDKLSKSETSNRRDGSSKRSREYMRRERNRSRSPRIRDERSRSPKREHSRRKRVKQSRHSHRDLQKSPEENSIDSLNRWQPSEDSR